MWQPSAALLLLFILPDETEDEGIVFGQILATVATKIGALSGEIEQGKRRRTEVVAHRGCRHRRRGHEPEEATSERGPSGEHPRGCNMVVIAGRTTGKEEDGREVQGHEKTTRK
jgi:hypothetical protein